MGFRIPIVASCVLFAFFFSSVEAADWPTWRGDAQRTAATTASVSEDLELCWSRELGAPAPAWLEDPRLQFDGSYEPIVVGRSLYVASSRDDSVTSYSTRTAEIQWRFFAEGPVRTAPVARRGKLFFGADDGIFYCLDAETGSLLWKFRVPHGRRVIGNGRLSWVFPIRGGPVIANGQVHFTAGVWPFEGTFLYSLALDASTYDVQHLGDRSPQGYLAWSGDRIVIPGGRDIVSSFDPGRQSFDALSYSSKSLTDYHVSASGSWIFHGSKIYDRATKRAYGELARRPIVVGKTIYSATSGRFEAIDIGKPRQIEVKDRKGKAQKKWVLTKLWSLENSAVNPLAPGSDTPKKESEKWLAANPLNLAVKAGSRLYGYQVDLLFALELRDSGPPEVVWKRKLDDRISGIVPADGRLFVSTARGTLHCFGPKVASPVRHALSKLPIQSQSSTTVRAALDAAPGSREGYCLVLGLGDGDLLRGLIMESNADIVGIDSDESKVTRLREELAASGHYGTRVTLISGALSDSLLPPYMANLILSADLEAAGLSKDNFASVVYGLLRPYGGLAIFPGGRSLDKLQDRLILAKLAGMEIVSDANRLSIRRSGALPGSADWTHEYSDPANSLMSLESGVKAPLGVLWYGGPSSGDELYFDRHLWAPSVAILEGRMIIQGPGILSCFDVYTGKQLWKRVIPLGVSPGRRGSFAFSGYHLVATKDLLYLAYSDRCLKIDPTTGKQLGELGLEDGERWGRIRIHEDLMVVSVFPETTDEKSAHPRKIVALDRHSGKRLWEYEAHLGLPFLAVGGGRVFAFDGYLTGLYRDYKRKGKIPEAEDEKAIVALDLQSGKPVWKKSVDLIVTWLSYSEEKDVTIVSNAAGMIAYQGRDGTELWSKEAKGVGFAGHPESVVDKVILWNDRVIDQRGPGLAYDLQSGQQKMTYHPLTREMVPWEFTKSGHHCNYAIASQNLLTFRSASAGFFDLESGGTSYLKGFRSGCRNSLIPANGVLNAPNFASGCVCSYSIFTSLALIHVPQNEKWTYSAFKKSIDGVQAVGINLGAPGDHRDEQGTLWLDYPSVLGTSPDIPIKVEPAGFRSYRRQASKLSGEGWSWVTSSGVEGIESIRLTLDADEKSTRSYTVKLYFAEPEMDVRPGERVFSIAVQGRVVLQSFDVASAAGGARLGIVRKIPDVHVSKDLHIELRAEKGKTLISGIEALIAR